VLAGREPVSGVRCSLGNFEYIFKMSGALQVAAVVPAEVLVAGDKRRHSLDPLRAYQSSQPPGHCLLSLFKSVSSLQGIAAMARGPRLSGQYGAHLAFCCGEVD